MVNVAATAVSINKFNPIRGPGGVRPRLLLAEDSNAARLLTAALLRRMGCDVDAVEHGQDAVEQAQDRHYDLILLDIEMPILDGVAAAQQIRALGGNAGRTPLMALSAFLADSAVTASWRSAFDHAIPKPAGREELHAAIQAILDSRIDLIRHRPPDDAPQPSDVPLVDWDIAGEIEAHLPRGQWLEIIMTAETEIAASIAAMRTDGAAASRRAHKIKGIAASFGLQRLAAEARILEFHTLTDISALKTEADKLMRLAIASMDCLRNDGGPDRDDQYG